MTETLAPLHFLYSCTFDVVNFWCFSYPLLLYSNMHVLILQGRQGRQKQSEKEKRKEEAI